MNGLYEKLRKWIPSKADGTESGILLSKIYSMFLGVNLKPLTEQFSSRIQTVKYDFAESALTSGAVCLFGSIGMSLVQLGYVNNIDELFTFASCYMLTDHYLDDNTVSLEQKVKTIHQINSFINKVTPLSGESVDTNIIDEPIIKSVADRYIDMVHKIPGSEHHLKESFRSEVKTMYLQRQKDLDRDTYLHLSEWKGGLFCNAIQSIINLPVTDRDYELGAAIQLVDEMLDIDDDIELGINTIATYDYSHDGNLDRLLGYTVDKIYNLDKVYTLFKPVLYLALIFAVHENRNKYSDEMIAMMDNFIYFKEGTTKKDLIVALMGYFDQ